MQSTMIICDCCYAELLPHDIACMSRENRPSRFDITLPRDGISCTMRLPG